MRSGGDVDCTSFVKSQKYHTLYISTFELGTARQCGAAKRGISVAGSKQQIFVQTQGLWPKTEIGSLAKHVEPRSVLDPAIKYQASYKLAGDKSLTNSKKATQ